MTTNIDNIVHICDHELRYIVGRITVRWDRRVVSTCSITGFLISVLKSSNSEMYFLKEKIIYSFSYIIIINNNNYNILL